MLPVFFELDVGAVDVEVADGLVGFADVFVPGGFGLPDPGPVSPPLQATAVKTSEDAASDTKTMRNIAASLKKFLPHTYDARDVVLSHRSGRFPSFGYRCYDVSRDTRIRLSL